MAPNEYTKALATAVEDLERRILARDVLNAEIAGLRETVRVLSSMSPIAKEEQEKIGRLFDMVDYATPSLTDSIRTILTRAYPKGVTAIEVRNALEEAQFNFSDFANPLSACHAALKRMFNDKEVTAETTKDGKTAYKRVLKMTPPTRPAMPDATLDAMMRALYPAPAKGSSDAAINQYIWSLLTKGKGK